MDGCQASIKLRDYRWHTVMSNVFVLVSSYFESYCPTYFFGPENISQENFTLLCKSLLEQAAIQSINNNTEFIGTNEIVRELVELLKTKGFNLFNPKIYDCFGPNILNNYSSFSNMSENISDVTKNKIIEHNNKIL